MFSVGDTVHLKSGGPEMTVEAVEADDVYCVWFHGQEPKRGKFKVASLSIEEGDSWGMPGAKILD